MITERCSLAECITGYHAMFELLRTPKGQDTSIPSKFISDLEYAKKLETGL